LKYTDKIFFKLARRVIIVSALLFVMIVAGFEGVRYLDQRDRMEGKLRELAATYSLLLSEPLYEDNLRTVRLISAGLMIDSDVEAFVIRDKDRQVIDAFGEMSAPVVVGDERSAGLEARGITDYQLITSNLHFHTVTSIQHADAQGTVVIGELELRLSPQRIYTLIIADLSMSIMLLGFFAVVVLITTRSAYTAFIGRRLNLLLGDIRRVEDSFPHQPVSSGGARDELGLIVDAYNEAHRRHQVSQDKIQHYQDSLEQQVADRTLDLERELEEHAITSRQLFLEKQRVDVTLNSIKDAVFNIDSKGRVVLANPACEQLLGIELLDCLGRSIFDLLPHEDVDNLSLVQDIQAFIDSGHSPHKTHEIYLRSQTDQVINAEVTLLPFVDSEQSSPGMAIFIRDVTLQYQITEKLTYEARHDPLTGLINRREFERRLSSFNSTPADNNEQHVLCFLDLDYFKVVNDTAGHQAGDQVLKDIATGLSGLLRTSDTLARFGGDEFGVILAACDRANASRICESMRAFVASYRFASGGVDFIFGVSIGVVRFAPGTFTSKELLRLADQACYAAKAEGRNKVCFDRMEYH
jgi:diguanylate cyclase (GGDEF)-like protein/PAS domain S-box-containing protein